MEKTKVLFSLEKIKQDIESKISLLDSALSLKACDCYVKLDELLDLENLIENLDKKLLSFKLEI